MMMKSPFMIALALAAFVHVSAPDALAEDRGKPQGLHGDTVKYGPPDNDRLYQSFGGERGIDITIEAFTRMALEDPRIAHTFEETNIERFKAKFKLQLCWLMGGPCVYDGFGMHESHAPLDIDTAEFNATVELFQDAMDEADVSFRTQNKLLKVLAPMKRDIVTK